MALRVTPLLHSPKGAGAAFFCLHDKCPAGAGPDHIKEEQWCL